MPRLALFAAACTMFLACPAVVRAQNDKPADAKATEQASKVLEQARKAIADVHAFSYQAVAEGAGSLAGKVPTVKADVTAARADAGGWKLYTKGTSSGADAGATKFEVSYDGVTGYSAKEQEKTMYESEPDNGSDLAVFFSGQGAKHPVAWEMISEVPLDLNGGTASAEPDAKVGEVPCDVVLLKPLPTETGPDTGATAGTRVWLAKSDHLPRKIERLLSTPAGASRVLTINNLKLDKESVGATYTMPVPEGFAVKNPDPKPERTAGGGRNGPKAPPAPPGQLKVGDQAPAFTLKDANGKDHSLSDYKGKVVLLDFWATWCPPCRMAMPGVQKIHEHFKSDPVVVIGMNTSENADPVKFMKDKGFTYGLLLNAETIGDKYGIQGIPAFFIIGPDGKLLWTEVGYNPAGEKEATEVIAKALKEIQK